MFTEKQMLGIHIDSAELNREMQLRKDEEYSFGKSIGAAFREAVPFGRQLMLPETFSLNFDTEDIDWKRDDIKELTSSIPLRYLGELHNSNNEDQLRASIAGIRSGLDDMQYMNEQHGIVASLGLYAAASVLDPLSWVGYGIANRIHGAYKFAENMSTMQKAGYWAGAGAVVEGGSEAIIQSYGAREFENVPIAAGIGAAFAGGGSMVHSLLTDVHIRDVQKATEELSESMPDTSTQGGMTKATQLLDTIKSQSTIQPVRTRLSNFIDKMTGQSSSLLRSPTYRAAIKGGEISAFANKIDTPAMLSKDGNGNFVKHEEFTVMDSKHENAKHLLDLEIARVKAFQESGMKEADFTTATWIETQKLRQRYDARLHEITKELELDENLVKSARDKAEAELDGTYKQDDISLERTNTIKKLEGKPNRTKEDDMLLERYREAEAEYRDKQIAKQVDDEVDKLIRREAMARVEDIDINTGNKGIDDMVMASSKYYESIHAKMIEAGIEGAEDMIPKFYQPVVYDTRAIKMHDSKEVVEAFAKSIRDSEAYQRMLSDAQEKLSKLQSKDIDAKVLKEIEGLESLHKELTDVVDSISNHTMYSVGIGDITAKLDRLGLDTASIQKTDDVFDNFNFDITPQENSLRIITDIVNKNKDIQELMELAGMDDMNILSALELGSAHKGYVGKISIDFELPLMGEDLATSHIRHELIHAISSRNINANPKFREELEIISNEIKARRDELEGVLVDNMHILDEKMFNGKSAESITERIDYMLSDPHELLAVAFSNKPIADALNKMKARYTKKGESILDKLFRAIVKSLGLSSAKSGTLLGKLANSMKKNLKENPISKKTREKFVARRRLANELDLLSIEAHYRGLSDIQKARKAEIEKKLNRADKALIKYIDDIKKKTEVYKANLDASKAAREEDISNAAKDIRRIKDYPEKASNKLVEKIQKQDKITDVDFANTQPSRLKGRRLPIDVTHEALEPYVMKNEAALNQMYHYVMSGRIATKGVLGYDNPKEMRRFLEDESGFGKEDQKIAMDMFELALGTRQIPSDPNKWWEKGVRMATHFNYATLGGQFGKTALSEIGAGVYRTGFEYMKELFPAMKSVRKMYKGQPLSKMEEDILSITEAGSIYEANMHSALADTDYIESTFAKGLEQGLKKLSTKMFRYSGLEGITVMTQMAIPRMFLRRIIKEANNPTAQLDMLRWGLDIDDMRAIAKQPYEVNERGVVTDFKFNKWDKGLAEKFQRVTTRMSRDTIMKPDAVRVPTWLNEGDANPLIKLTKQFMTFTFLSNERLMLAGLNERQAMAITGTVISAAILYMIEKGSEEFAVASGIIDEDEQRYDGEEGQMKLAGYIATRNSFAGGLGFSAEILASMGTPYGDEQLLSKVAGGVTTSRAMAGARAVMDTAEGKMGTRNQVNFMASLIPFNTLFGLHTFNKDVARGIVEDAERNGWNE